MALFGCDSHEAMLPVSQMVVGSPEAPLDIPLHPAAERFWRERGYIYKHVYLTGG